MPLEIEAPGRTHPDGRALVIGLVNNMPDAALEATETQFRTLLEAAAGPSPVRLRLSYLPEISRESTTLTHIEKNYWPLNDLLESSLDALIVTGTEPRAPALEKEPYWPRMKELVDWAQRHTLSSIWSCLAAHAVTQVIDGVRRRLLPVKRFGVFQHERQPSHTLLRGLGRTILTPHSRWNELPQSELRAAGYTIASCAADSGVDIFIKSSRSLLVGFQGHPEYEATTLLKEYRRDIGRYLRGEQAAWPALPGGYFPRQALPRLDAFRERATCSRDPDLLCEFPIAQLAAKLHAPWRPAAEQIYRNWLTDVSLAKQCTLRRSHRSL